MRPTRDDWAMALVDACASRTTCLRRAVGCVLLNARGHVLATGYNGVAAGLPHCNEAEDVRRIFKGQIIDAVYTSPYGEEQSIGVDGLFFPRACPGATSPSGTNLDGCQAIHAEQNALLQCRDVWAIDTCYVSASPCLTCVKLLLNTSCQRIVFREGYPHGDAEKLWRQAGRDWVKYHK